MEQSILGIDLGGTKTAVARYDEATMELQASKVFPTRADKSFAHVRDGLIAQIKELRTDDTRAIGIGVPGLVSADGSNILTLPNIPGSGNQDLVSFVKSATKLPVVMCNDADAFTLAEALDGAGGGERVVVGITLGTGVGGGIVIDGEIFRGAHGYAGEIGHMLLRPGEPPYETDDRRGEVEQFLSGTAMGKRCREAGKPEEYLEGEVCEFMRPEIFREVAWLVTNLTHLLDPSVIVFGGSAGKALTPHLGAVEKELRQWMLAGVPLPRLTIGIIEDAATRGAAMLAKM